MKKNIAFFLIGCLIFLAACSSNSVKKVDLNNLMAKIKSDINNSNMIDLGKDDFMNYYGINADELVQFSAIINGTGVDVDEIVLIEAKDSAASADIKTKLDARYQSKINEAANYNAEGLAIIKKGKVQVNGNYVSLLVTTNIDKILEDYNNAFK